MNFEKCSIRGAMTRADDTSRVISFRASTDSIDRHGTRVRPEGIDTRNYQDNPMFAWAHDAYGSFLGVPRMEHVIGRTVGIRKTSNALDIDVEFAPPDINPTADMAFRMVKGKFLNAVSIGFIPLDLTVNMENGVDVPVITRSELLEVSLVSIPSNPDALALSRKLAAELESLLRGATSFSNLPLSDRERAWDASAARSSLGDDFAVWKRAHFWFDSENADVKGGYKLPFAERINGTLTAVWRGVTAAAQRLDQTQIPDADKARVRTHIGKYYAKARDQFNDDSIVPPWERDLPTSPSDEADFDVVMQALQGAFTEWQVRQAIRSAL